MLRDKILALFQNCEPDIRNVLGRVIEVEWANLSLEKPRVTEEIRQIVDAEARSKDHEA